MSLIQDRDSLSRRALRLSYFTVIYNALEGLLSILASILSGSVALLGFGLDSALESLSGFVMIWRFGRHGSASEEDEKSVERRAARLIAITFFILGGYVFYESAKKLYLREMPEASLLGVIVALAAVFVMPVLFYRKYGIAKALGSRSLLADSKETLACFILSLALLAGLLANWFLDFWQADPFVGLLIFGYLVKEGHEAWRGEEDGNQEEGK